MSNRSWTWPTSLLAANAQAAHEITGASFRREIDRFPKNTAAYTRLAIVFGLQRAQVLVQSREHLRQHRRTTVNADRFLDPVRRYLGHDVVVTFDADVITSTRPVRARSNNIPRVAM